MTKRRHYVLHAEPGRYEIRGSDVHLGLLVPLARLYYTLALRAAHEGVAFGSSGAVESRVSPYVAVFFAFASAEAYPPELLARAPTGPAAGVDRTKLAKAIEAREGRKRVSLADAYAGDDKGVEWYMRLRCLGRLRDELVHFKARPHGLNEWPARLSDEAEGCRDVIRGWVVGAHDWTSQLLVPPVAAWACETVRLAIEGLHARVGGAHPWAASVPPTDRWP